MDENAQAIVMAHARAIVQDYQEWVELRCSYGEWPPRMLVIMRGLPGSGKSTLAEAISRLAPTEICSADEFFQSGDRYVFNPRRLGEAHDACFNRCRAALQDWPDEGVDIVIVDNTNIRTEDFERYVELSRWPVMLKVVAFQCPRGPLEAAILCARSSRHGRNIPGNTVQDWYNMWCHNQNDERNNYYIDLEDFLHPAVALAYAMHLVIRCSIEQTARECTFDGQQAQQRERLVSQHDSAQIAYLAHQALLKLVWTHLFIAERRGLRSRLVVWAARGSAIAKERTGGCALQIN